MREKSSFSEKVKAAAIKKGFKIKITFGLKLAYAKKTQRLFLCKNFIALPILLFSRKFFIGSIYAEMVIEHINLATK